MNPYDMYMMGALADDAGLGAAMQMLPTRMIARAPITSHAAASRVTANRAIANQIAPGPYPGTPARAPREWPLGMGSFNFTNALGLTQAVLTARPQRVFQGQRLVVVVARSAGASGIGVTIDAPNVGANPQTVDPATTLPAEAFSPDAQHTVLDMDPCSPGILVTLNVFLDAVPGAGENVSVSAVIIGTSLG